MGVVGSKSSLVRDRKEEAAHREDRVPILETLEDGKVGLVRYEANQTLKDVGEKCLKVASKASQIWDKAESRLDSMLSQRSLKSLI